MPTAPLRPCLQPGCAHLVSKGHCPTHQQGRVGHPKRLYNYRWQQARKAFISEHPCCALCRDNGMFTPTYAVDHIEPHRGNLDLFWDQDNWQPLCQSHHNAKAMSERTR